MAEINFNNLYNQLKPMEKRFYDEQFQKSYNPNQENIMLSSQPAYEQMKAVYDAQQQVPEESFLDKINIFGSASAAEMPQVPNLTYRNIDLPFDLRTGVTNTTAASPFLKSMADIDASGVINSDLVNQLIMEDQMKANQFDPTNFRSIFPTNVEPMPQEPTGITSTDQAQTFGTSVDNFQGFTDKEDFSEGPEKNFLQKLAQFIPFAGEKSLSRAILNMLPQMSPEAKNMRNFYGSRYGLTDTGQVASGIMKGYNPVSGSNLLNKITGGRFGQPTQYGLAPAIRRRIDRIANRKIAQTDISRARIKELQDLARADTTSRARQAAPNVYRDAGDRGTLGPGGGFSTSGREGAFSSKSGRGRQDF